MGKCRYDLAWVGKCGKPTVGGSDYCKEHSKEKCAVCGEQATHQCSVASSFVCGCPLCSKKECVKTHNGRHY